MASTRRSRGFGLRHPVVVDVGCSCRRPKKLSSLFSSFSISHSKPKNASTSSSSPATTATTMNTTTTTTTTATATSTTSTWDASFTTTNSLYEEEEEEYHHSPQHPMLNEGRRPTGASNGGRGRRRGRRRRRKGQAQGQGQGQGRVERESVAVAVETEEPYEDFKESMVRMVVENEIYAWDDLNDLLHRFLSLNSPRHHSLILRAFADLWTGLFSPPSPCL